MAASKRTITVPGFSFEVKRFVYAALVGLYMLSFSAIMASTVPDNPPTSIVTSGSCVIGSTSSGGTFYAPCGGSSTSGKPDVPNSTYAMQYFHYLTAIVAGVMWVLASIVAFIMWMENK